MWWMLSVCGDGRGLGSGPSVRSDGKRACVVGHLLAQTVADDGAHRHQARVGDGVVGGDGEDGEDDQALDHGGILPGARPEAGATHQRLEARLLADPVETRVDGGPRHEV